MPFPVHFPAVPLRLRHAVEGDVDAVLRLAVPEDADSWAHDWRPDLVTADRSDGQWPWKEHIERASSEEGWLALVLARPTTLEGMVSLRLARGESRLAAQTDVVYVEYLGVAPRHQLPPVGQRLIRGIGKALMLATIRISRDIGCDGRVGLHSKPDAEAFYRTLRFTAVDYEEMDDGRWLYFE